ncbi:MAG TPA: hypothetical protein VFE57_11535 [Cyclobacteriaceae bacterium]|jgi:hypothetical protein|nr:hypothetical protein [Cyclobacteriaceae bacterium]
MKSALSFQQQLFGAKVAEILYLVEFYEEHLRFNLTRIAAQLNTLRNELFKDGVKQIPNPNKIQVAIASVNHTTNKLANPQDERSKDEHVVIYHQKFVELQALLEPLMEMQTAMAN